MAKVLTVQQEYEIECAIYNDDNKTLFKSLPQGVEDHNNEHVIKDLAKGQEYHIIPQTNVMLRQDGRLFNLKFIRGLKPMWTPHDILANLSGKQIRFSDMFKQNGWKFNHKAITKNYVDNDWGISVSKTYTPTLRDFISAL